MVRLDLLEEALVASGLKRQFVADSLGLTPQGLLNKLTGVRSFKIEEVSCLSEILRLDTSSRDRIFFAQQGE